MERYLKTGDKIEIKGIDGHYTIKSVVGYGSSCVVYSTEFCNLNEKKTEHLLKEFNPKRINLDRKDGALVPVHKEQIVLFEELRERFKKGFEKQSELRKIPELKNYTANIQNIYEDYETIYIDMTETAGRSYKDVNEKSIFDLAQRIKVLAEVIGNYHKQGYLHLDIKPGNIFVRPEDETCQDVLLFDFDSLVPFTEENGTCVIGKEVAVSYTTDYAPIELLSASRRNRIGKQTDIYEIGEVFFEKLMGRHSNALEHNGWAKYDYDWDSDIFKNINPKVKPLLDELFHKTLCSTASERFATTNELVTCLEKIIKIADPKAPYLKTSLPQNLAFFTGREAEIKTIHEKLKENDLVFLSGVGGIGKTELAKNYAHKYKDCYDAIIFAPFVSDVQMMILDDKNVPIYNFFQYPAEEPQEYFARKMRKLKELCDKGTLIIVDNLDTIENDDYKELFELGCKMLVTTRIDFSEIYSGAEYINIGELSNPFDVFNEYYEKPLSDEQQKCVEEIIDIVCGHTMTVELLAKQMKAGRVKPEKMLEKLKNGGISESGKEKVGTIKDGNVAMQSTYDHIQKLFDLSGLSEDEQYILANLSLIPFTGVSTELFYEWCELETYDTINNLIAEGWIRHDKEKDYISLHPLISELRLCRVIDTSVFKTFMESYVNHLRNRALSSETHHLDDNKININVLRIIEKYNFIESVFSVFLGEISGYLCLIHQFDLALLASKINEKIVNQYYSLDVRAVTASMVNTAFIKACFGAETGNKNVMEEAIKIYLVAIENHKSFDETKYPDNYDDIAQLYNYAGSAYEDLDDIVNARIMFVSGIEMYSQRKELVVQDYESLAMLYNNLGNTYKGDEAVQYYLKAQNYHKEIGTMSRSYAITLYHLAELYSNNKYSIFNINTALDYAKQAMSFFEENYCEDYYMIAKTKFVLGKILAEYSNEECITQAICILQDASKIFEEYSIDNSENITIQDILNNLYLKISKK